jgi:hypothetical protein
VEKLARAATRKIAMRIIRVLVISDLTVAVPAAGIRLPFSATETSVRRRFGQLSVKVIWLTASQHTILAT